MSTSLPAGTLPASSIEPRSRKIVEGVCSRVCREHPAARGGMSALFTCATSTRSGGSNLICGRGGADAHPATSRQPAIMTKRAIRRTRKEYRRVRGSRKYAREHLALAAGLYKITPSKEIATEADRGRHG